jgi:glutamine synthetase
LHIIFRKDTLRMFFFFSYFMSTIIDMKEVAKQDAVLKVMVTDLSGGFKEIISHTSRLPEVCKVGMAYDGSSFSGINQINASDAILMGNPETLVQVPQRLADTEKPEYMIICNIHTTDGKPHPNCARSQLVRLQKDLAKVWSGGNMYMGSEPEAYFIHQEKGYTEGDGNSNYFNPKDPKTFIITEIANTLDEMGFVMERAHTEVGDDQFECNWQFDKAERTADKIQYFKLIAHKIAREYGYDVTFLPKPYPGRNGSGMHCHISVQNDKQNLFYDAKSKEMGFSETALQFLTGVLEHSRAISAIANSTEVSYSRLVPGFEAPCIVAIGSCNRSAACRVPAIADEKVRSKAIRAEFRYPDPLANPYLLACGFIAAGMDGVEKKAKFLGFTNENLYALDLAGIRKKGFTMLPRNLWEAYNEYTSDKVLAKKFGPMFDSHADIILEEIEECQPFANTRSMDKHYYA